MKADEIQKYLLFQRKKYFFKSLFRKAKNLIVHFISLENISADHLFFKKNLRGSSKTSTYLPKSLDEIDSAVQTKIPAVQLLGLQHVYFSSDTTAFLDKNFQHFYIENINEFAGDHEILYNTQTLHFHSHQLAKISNLPKVQREEEILFLAGTFNFNYFHFLVELLPKVEFLKEIPNYKKLIVVVGSTAEVNTNFKMLLSFFIKENIIEYLEDDKFYSFAKTWHITYPNSVVPNIAEGNRYQAHFSVFSEQSIDYVRKVCFDHFDTAAVKVKAKAKIFLARKSIFRRYNEHELVEIAKNYGFEAVYFEDCNIHEQIFYVRNAEYIIGPSGAAWTNIIFSKKNKTKGLMWLGKVWNDFAVFSTLAKIVAFDLYHYRYDQQNPLFHGDYELPLPEFEMQLKKLLLK